MKSSELDPVSCVSVRVVSCFSLLLYLNNQPCDSFVVIFELLGIYANLNDYSFLRWTHIYTLQIELTTYEECHLRVAAVR